MKYNKNKKGVSAIVATSLIILITVAAITIVWSVVIPMIQDSLQSGQACLNAPGAITIRTRTGQTWYNTTSDMLYVQIERTSADIDIAKINLRAITSEGNAENIQLETSNVTAFKPNGLDPADVVVYSQDFSEDNETVIVSVEISPVIVTGAKEYSCSDAVARAEIESFE